MKWYKKLYLGENAEKSRYKVFGRIKMNKFSFNTYLIVLPSNKENLLDIISAFTAIFQEERKQGKSVCFRYCRWER